MKPIEQLPHHIYENVVVDAHGCWVYQGRLKKGYGESTWNGSRWYVHRLTYMLFNGPIPKGLVIDHLCCNKACCRPLHLEAVTNAENLRRAWDLAIRPGMLDLRRGKLSNTDSRARKLPSNCRNGHPYPSEPARKPSGTRMCLLCKEAETGRSASMPIQRGPRQTCKSGRHAWTPENIVLNAGFPRCRLCRELSKPPATQPQSELVAT